MYGPLELGLSLGYEKKKGYKKGFSETWAGSTPMIPGLGLTPSFVLVFAVAPIKKRIQQPPDY